MVNRNRKEGLLLAISQRSLHLFLFASQLATNVEGVGYFGDSDITSELSLDLFRRFTSIFGKWHPFVGMLQHDLPSVAIDGHRKLTMRIHARTVLAGRWVVHFVRFLRRRDALGLLKRRQIDRDGVADDGDRARLHICKVRDKSLDSNQTVDILRPGFHGIV